LFTSAVCGTDLPARGEETYGKRAACQTFAAGFFPRRTRSSGSSRPLRCKKAVSSGAPHALRPEAGSQAFRFPSRSRHHEGIGSSRTTEEDKTMTAIGHVTKNDNGSYKGQLRTVSIRADIDIIPNRDKTAETHPDFRVFTQGVEIGAGWIRRGENSGKDYVSLSLAAPEFGPRKLYANLGCAAGQDDDSVLALIWNPAD
jgi:uncharacterized protein (DUF736 family)